MATNPEDLLYRSFDEQLSAEEQRKLDEALAQSPGLRHEKQVLEIIRNKLHRQMGSQKFRPFFAERVMAEIRARSRQEPFWESLVAVFRPVAIAAAIAMVAIIGYNLTQSKTISVTSALGEPEITMEQMLDPSFAMTLE